MRHKMDLGAHPVREHRMGCQNSWLRGDPTWLTLSAGSMAVSVQPRSRAASCARCTTSVGESTETLAARSRCIPRDVPAWLTAASNPRHARGTAHFTTFAGSDPGMPARFTLCSSRSLRTARLTTWCGQHVVGRPSTNAWTAQHRQSTGHTDTDLSKESRSSIQAAWHGCHQIQAITNLAASRVTRGTTSGDDS